MVDVYLSLLDH